MQTCEAEKREESVEGVAVWETVSPHGFEYRLFYTQNTYTLLIGGSDGERCRFEDLARTEEGAMFLARLLSRGEVSPVNAAEVIEDLLARDPSLFV